MAIGHVNRTYRPNTWLHRPKPAYVKKVLANPEPSTHGSFETCRRTLRMSAYRGRPEVIGARSERRDWTHCGSDRFEGRAPYTFVSFRGPLRSIEPLIAIVLDCMHWKSAQAHEV